MTRSVNFDIIFDACCERFPYKFTLKMSEAAFGCYTRPHVRSNAAAANVEVAQKTCYCLTRETLREKRLHETETFRS